jgi:DNA-binding IscR family transcriptional regulator
LKFLEKHSIGIEKGRILESKKGKGGGYYIKTDPLKPVLPLLSEL